MELKIELNPNPAEVERIREAVRLNDGYCPCRISKTPESRCMCKWFKETQRPGYCCCGLYRKVEVADETEDK